MTVPVQPRNKLSTRRRGPTEENRFRRGSGFFARSMRVLNCVEGEQFFSG
jgi:hypothetical protein